MSSKGTRDAFRFAPQVEGLEERVTPASQLTAVADAGGGTGIIAVYNSLQNNKLLSVINFAPGITVTSLSVATGDVNGDGFDDVVAAVGRGSNLPSLVRVFLGQGTTGAFGPTLTGVASTSSFDFLAYGTFTGGVSLAVGDVDPSNNLPPSMTSSGKVAEIITGVASGGPGLIKVFEYGNQTPIDQGFALNPVLPFTKGITLAAGDINADGNDDIVVGFRDGPLVRVFQNQNVTGATTYTPFAWDNGTAPAGLLANIVFQPSFFSTGFYVGAGDQTGDGVADIILGNIEGNATTAAVVLPTLYTPPSGMTPGSFNGVDANNFKAIVPVGLPAGTGLPVKSLFNGIVTGQTFTTANPTPGTSYIGALPQNVALAYTQSFNFGGGAPTPLFDYGNPPFSGIPDFFLAGFLGGIAVG
jgi:hypothetical protein